MSVPESWERLRSQYAGQLPFDPPSPVPEAEPEPDYGPRQCVNENGRPKQPFPLAKFAEKAARKILAEGTPHYRPGKDCLIVYRCQICRKWHIGQGTTTKET